MQSEIPYTSANLSINGLGVPILVAMEAGAELRGMREADDRRSPTRHHPADSETENNTDGGGGGNTTGDVVANSRGYKVLKIDGSPSSRKKKTSLSSNSNGSNNNGTSEARTSESMDVLEPGRGGSIPQVSASSTEESLAGEEGSEGKEVGELRGVRFHPGSDQDFLFTEEGDAAPGRNNGSSCPSSSDHDSRQRGPGENLGPPSRRVRGSSPVVGQSRRRLVSSELRLPPKSSAGRKSSSSLGGGGGHKSSGSGGSQARGGVPTSAHHSPEDGGAQSGDPEAGVSHVESTSTLNSEEGDSDAFSSEPQLQSCLSSSEREPSSGGGGGGSRPGGRSSRDPPKRRISFPAESVLTAVVQDGDIPELMRILSDPRDRVDINQESHVGLTALHHGVLSNNLDAVKILLTHGAQVNAKDVHGFSPLHTASACGFLQIVSLLVLFGADVFALTSQAEMPVDLAKDVSVIRLLMVEMTRQIHEELYVPALVASKVKHLAAVCQRLLLLLLAHLAHLVAAAWRRYKRKTE